MLSWWCYLGEFSCFAGFTGMPNTQMYAHTDHSGYSICSNRPHLALLAVLAHTHTHTHTRLTALCPGLPGWAGTRKVQSIWILLKQETVGGSRISWAMCKSSPRSRQITMPTPHCSDFYRPDALPDAQPTASKHWRLAMQHNNICKPTPWLLGVMYKWHN